VHRQGSAARRGHAMLAVAGGSGPARAYALAFSSRRPLPRSISPTGVLGQASRTNRLRPDVDALQVCRLHAAPSRPGQVPRLAIAFDPSSQRRRGFGRIIPAASHQVKPKLLREKLQAVAAAGAPFPVSRVPAARAHVQYSSSPTPRSIEQH
jgi:hypothetical protein